LILWTLVYFLYFLLHSHMLLSYNI
jgi:hypothetical protein